jgi:hypothetical protein
MTIFKKFTDITSYKASEQMSQEDMPEITDEPEYPFDDFIYRSLLLSCYSAAARHKNPALPLDTYLLCWTQDMETQIKEAGIDPDKFITEALSHLASQSSSGASSSTTSASGTTSSSSSKPTKTASPTSLF